MPRSVRTGSTSRTHRQRLLLSAYLSGVVALVMGTQYFADAELSARIQCRTIRSVKALLPIQTVTPGDQRAASSGEFFDCCASQTLTETTHSARPILRNVRPPAGRSGSAAPPILCLFGENFGPSRGPSVLTIGGTPAAGYLSWTDPGPPNDGRHMAQACATAGRWTPPGKQTVLLTTAAGVSNSIWIEVSGSPSGTKSVEKVSATPQARIKASDQLLPASSGLSVTPTISRRLQ